jgi:RNA polymerase sigma-70 factor (ECF subfamily)
VDEQALIQRCQAGDWQAFEPLFRSHVQMAVRTAYLITRDWAAAEDAAQEAFIRAYRALGSFRPGSPFAPWLYRIVVNEARRAAARRGRARAEALDPERLGNLHDSGRELQSEVWESVQELDKAHRLVVILKYFRGFSEAEIAAVLDLRPSTVKSRLYVARQRLLAMLGRTEEVEA